MKYLRSLKGSVVSPAQALAFGPLAISVLWLFVGVLLGALMHWVCPVLYRLDIRLHATAPEGGNAVVYYSHDGAYTQQAVAPLWHRSERGDPVFWGRILSSKPIRRIRIDPTDRVGLLDWRTLGFQGLEGGLAFNGRELFSLKPEYDQLKLLAEKDERLSFESTGGDAKISLSVPQALTAIKDPHRETVRRWAFGLAALISVMGAVLHIRKEQVKYWRRRAVSWRDALAHRLSDEATVVFSGSAMNVYGVLLVMFVAWVGLGLQQSSLGVWDDLYATGPAERDVSLGYPKFIRGDEWGVLTPWTFSQVQTGMAVDNPNMGAPGSSILAGTPVAGPLMLAQPKYWGFEFLDIERGFAWYWGFKTFGLIAAVFTLMLLLTRGDVWVSMATSAALFGASTVQWLFSGFAPEMVIGMCVAVLGTVYLLQARKVGGMAAGAVMVALVVPNLLMHLYPPHLLPLAHLSIFLLMGLFMRPGTLGRFADRLGWRFSWMAFAAIAMGLLVWVWYSSSAGAVKLVMNTVYPGKRFSLGGDLPLMQVFHGMFESWRIGEWPVPFPPTDQTQASRLWVLFPLMLLIVPVRYWFRRSSTVQTSLLLYCFWVLCWTSMSLPESVRLVLAKTGWFLSVPWHSVFGMGVASILMVSTLVAQRARGELPLVSVSWWLLPLAAFVVVLSYGLALSQVDPEFFVLERIALAAVVVAAIVFSVMRGARRLYWMLMILVALPPIMQVNPLQNGIQSYLQKDLFVAAKGLAPQGQWAVYGDMRVANGLQAVGLHVFNGVHYAPRMQYIQVLDPSGRDADVWNRYAHVELISGKTGQAPGFDLVFPDHYQIALDVCGQHIRQLGVTHVLYTYPPSEAERACLEPLAVPVADVSVSYFRLR